MSGSLFLGAQWLTQHLGNCESTAECMQLQDNKLCGSSPEKGGVTSGRLGREI